MGKTSTVKHEQVNVAPPAAPQLLLPDAASTAEIVLGQAIRYCAAKMGLDATNAAIERLKEGDRTACGYCQYSVAKQMAEALGSLDDNVKAVYAFEYDATPEDVCLGEAVHIPTVHMLVWVTRRTSALTSMLEGLDRALAQHCAKMMGQPEATHLLDAQVVTDAEVASHSGYGALLVSLHNRPIKLWER